MYPADSVAPSCMMRRTVSISMKAEIPMYCFATSVTVTSRTGRRPTRNSTVTSSPAETSSTLARLDERTSPSGGSCTRRRDSTSITRYSWADSGRPLIEIWRVVLPERIRTGAFRAGSAAITPGSRSSE